MVPVFLHLVVTSSRVSSGSRVFKLLTSAFLFVMSTPDLGRGSFTHAVMTSSFGGCRSGARVILPRYVMDLAVRVVKASGVSWKILWLCSLFFVLLALDLDLSCLSVEHSI